MAVFTPTDAQILALLILTLKLVPSLKLLAARDQQRRNGSAILFIKRFLV
jgi:hypothetical protein